VNKEEWPILVDAFRILAPALAGYAVYLLKGILKELRSLNDRLLEVEQWQTSHDKLDDTRFADVRREIDSARHAKGR
jgi:hypothetical protein